MTRAEYRRYSQVVRAAAELSRSPYPIVEVEGTQPPTLRGESYYWTTLSGRTIVRHPNAYGWPTLYHHSTLEIVVGRQWLTERSLPTSTTC